MTSNLAQEKNLAIYCILLIISCIQSTLSAPPDSVLVLNPGDYCVANYPEAFNAFTKEGITIELWFYLSDIPLKNSERWVLFYKPNGFYALLLGRDPEPLFIDEPKGTVYMSITAMGGRDLAGCGSIYCWEPAHKDYPLKRWTYLAFQVRGTEVVEESSVVNGVNLNDGSCWLGRPPSNTPDPLFIGGRPGYESLIGWIDEVRISKGWRFEIPANFEPKRRFTNDKMTLALWHFDEGIGASRFKDSSGNGYTLVSAKDLMVKQDRVLTVTWGELKR